MSQFLIFAYLFFIGSTIGWVIELIFRRFFSKSNPERKWINPGFCTGPYLPIYGFGLYTLRMTAELSRLTPFKGVLGTIATLALMTLAMTLIEYIAGIICLKLLHVRLWDYSDEWGNLQGIICPLFTLLWGIAGALYYFLVHPHIVEALNWLAENLAFSFVIGFFFGVFVIDVSYNANIVARVKRYADEKQVVIHYERLKAVIRSNAEKAMEKTNFLFPFKTAHSLQEHLREREELLEKRIRERIKKHIR